MTDINKEYEKEYYDEYRNNYYNPDDDDGEPGINLNWKRIQKGFHSVAAGDQETAETLSGMQANLETLNTDVETLKSDVEEIQGSIGNLNTAVETAEQAAEAAAASEAAAEAAQTAIEEIAESIPEDYSELSADVVDLKRSVSDDLTGGYVSIMDGDEFIIPGIIYNIPWSSSVKNTAELSIRNKNWIKNDAVSKTENGVTFTVNTDGSITVSGTATATFEFIITENTQYFYQFPENTPFVLSGSPINDDVTKYKLRMYVNSHDYIDSGNGIEIPNIRPAGGVTKISIVVYSGTVMDNVIFYPLLTLKGQFGGSYEPPKEYRYSVSLAGISPQMYGGTVDFTTGKCVSLYDASGNPVADPVEYNGEVVAISQAPLPIRSFDGITNITGAINSYQFGSIDVDYMFSVKDKIDESAKLISSFVYVAASNSVDSAKYAAKYVCDGVNDELTIQTALNYANANSIGEVRLAEGDYFIDSFPRSDPSGIKIALAVGTDGTTNKSCCVKLAGCGNGGIRKYGTNSELFKGAVLHVTQECYDTLSSEDQYAIIGTYTPNGVRLYPTVKLDVENLSFKLPGNQKKIICVDGWNCTAFSFADIQCMAITVEGGSTTGNISPEDLIVAVEGCIGIRGTQGDCYGIENIWKNSFVWGFYEGFSVTGEHIVATSLGARFCNYGFTFGVCDGRAWEGAFVHPNTLINCCDELNFNLPLFGKTGVYSIREDGKQYINLIDYNMEWRPAYAALGGDLAKEITPGIAYGSIVYTNRISINEETQFWESGHGLNVSTRNGIHVLGGSTTLRTSYTPNYLQQYYDTTLNKLLIYDGTNWRDTQGTIV